MLDVAYGSSALLTHPAHPVGVRIPDCIGDDGERLLGSLWEPVILYSRCEAAANALATRLKVPTRNADVAELRKFFGRDTFVAFVRPDRIIGWVGDPDRAEVDTCAAALGVCLDTSALM